MTKVCPVCGKEFAPVMQQMFCSRPCRDKHYRSVLKDRAESGESGKRSRRAEMFKRLARIDAAYAELNVPVMTQESNGRVVEWRGQKVLGANAVSVRVRY